MSRLRFGTFFFFQAAPGQRHEDIIRNELTQVERSEELYRVPQQESRERFDETVDVMQRGWTEERFSYHGRFSGLTRRCTRCA